MDDFFDRGTIKWTAMMLPEHVHMLRNHDWNKTKIEKPELDDQEWEEIGRAIQEALEFRSEITVKYFSRGYIKKITGQIRGIDSKYIKVGDKFVNTKDIIGAK